MPAPWRRPTSTGGPPMGEPMRPMAERLLGWDSVQYREASGPREDERNTHVGPCNGLLCPCYQEGTEVRAHNHWSMLQWFAAHAPDLMVKALEEAGHSG